jgi:hypothetical protein
MLAVALAALVGGHAASHASQPDLLVEARHACTDCVEEMPAYLQPCLDLARDRPGVFGDLVVTATPQPDQDDPGVARRRLTVSATDGLGPQLANCAQERLRQSECLTACFVYRIRPLDVRLGTPHPILPRASDLLPLWRAYKESSWLTRGWRGRSLRQSLSADVRLTPDRCLWIPETINLREGLLAWEKGFGHPLPPAALERFGLVTTQRPKANWDRGYQISTGEAILVGEGLGIDDRLNWREYDETRGVRICLVPMAGAR